jgi:hypothetical protein
MYTLAQTEYLDSTFGAVHDLPRAGSALENPYVFDASARELKAMAAQGLVEIVEEHCVDFSEEVLIDRLRFTRLR